ncbi:hypothetical protein SETIT_8G051000v2 [Setaria italica]|uniref:protein-serine/threonine phosphatase n=1 Tax=Setaria italica TaxID=4555 RepID=A0A368S612_SETIT|nr:hypothetical protein SETIT_8G051000v2 [Setaria italica]
MCTRPIQNLFLPIFFLPDAPAPSSPPPRLLAGGDHHPLPTFPFSPFISAHILLSSSFPSPADLSPPGTYDVRKEAIAHCMRGCVWGAGHRGAIAAEYVKEHLLRNLIEHPKSITDTKAAIGGRLLVANVGDSRAVICKGGQGITNSDERHIIEDAGGYVMWDEGWRVGGVVPVSRAFGDKLLKQYVVADPEIKEVVVDSSLEFIILASNGLWQVVTNEGAVAIAKRHIWDPEESAKELPNEAYKRETSDNTTVVIVRFLHENSELPSI